MAQPARMTRAPRRATERFIRLSIATGARRGPWRAVAEGTNGRPGAPRVECAREMTTIERSTWTTKVGLARMLAGGVIMDVVTADQAQVAEEAGAVAVMALERVP